MKTQEELNQLKKEYEELNKKFQELSEEEIIQVTGGFDFIDSDDYIHEETYEK